MFGNFSPSLAKPALASISRIYYKNFVRDSNLSLVPIPIGNLTDLDQCTKHIVWNGNPLGQRETGREHGSRRIRRRVDEEEEEEKEMRIWIGRQ